MEINESNVAKNQVAAKSMDAMNESKKDREKAMANVQEKKFSLEQESIKKDIKTQTIKGEKKRIPKNPFGIG